MYIYIYIYIYIYTHIRCDLAQPDRAGKTAPSAKMKYAMNNTIIRKAETIMRCDCRQYFSHQVIVFE